MSLPLIRQHYGVPAYRGRHVTVDGVPGVIVSADGMYLRVQTAEGRIKAHPTWRVDYDPDDETMT